MKQFYFLLALFTVVFSSCSMQLGYLGNNYSPTEKVEVYVDASSIKKPFDVVGKGYIESLLNTRYTVKKLQAKAVELAKRTAPMQCYSRITIRSRVARKYTAQPEPIPSTRE